MLNFWPFRSRHAAAEWREHDVIFKVTTIDGEIVDAGYLMKRRGPDGLWQYRRMTPDEERELISELAW